MNEKNETKTVRRRLIGRLVAVTFVVSLAVFISATALSDEGLPDSLSGWLGLAGFGISISIVAAVIIGGLIGIRGTRQLP